MQIKWEVQIGRFKNQVVEFSILFQQRPVTQPGLMNNLLQYEVVGCIVWLYVFAVQSASSCCGRKIIQHLCLWKMMERG